MDTYLLKAGNTLINMRINDIHKVKDHYEVYMTFVTIKNKKNHIISYDEVISCAGFVFDNSILDDPLKPDASLFRKQDV